MGPLIVGQVLPISDFSLSISSVFNIRFPIQTGAKSAGFSMGFLLQYYQNESCIANDIPA